MISETELPTEVRNLYPFVGKRLDLGNGLSMHYLDEGKGETLLFVHGNPTWSFYWRNLVKAFSDRYRCVVPDHIGCGLSSKPQDYAYTLANHIENLTKLVKALDLREITLVVHDWGGAIGFGALLDDPTRVKRLVVFNTGAFEGPIPWEIRACRWPVVGALAIRGFNGFVRVGLFRATADRSRFKNGVAAGYLAPYGNWGDRIANLRFVQDIPLEVGHPTRELFVKNGEKIGPAFAHAPMVIFWGEQDFCFVPAYRDGWIARFPKAEVHSYPDGSHWIVEDKLEDIVPKLTDFLSRHPLQEGPQA